MRLKEHIFPSRIAKIKLLRGQSVTVTDVYIPPDTPDINAELKNTFSRINERQKDLGNKPFEMYVLDGTLEAQHE